MDRNKDYLASSIPSIDALLDFSSFSDTERKNAKRFIEQNKLDFKILYDRYILVKDISQEQILNVKSLIDKSENISIIASHKRYYSLGSALGNVLGYVGFPTEEQINDISSAYSFTEEYVGKTGIEKTYQNYLRGTPSVVQFEKNVKGDIRRTVEKSKLIQGSTIITTIDGKFQKKIYDIMDNYMRERGYKKGALVALDPRNGEIIAMISYPNYDNNAFLRKSEEVKEILTNSRSPLFNRVTSGLYAPGSTVKPMVAIGALEEKIISPDKQIYSSGELRIPNPYFPGQYSVFKDWKKHGWTNMYKAIANSVNVYFYTIGGGFNGQEGLGVKRLKKYYQKFGLGSKTGIDFDGEKAGLVADPETKKKTIDPVWRLGDTFNMSIGQGSLEVTPLQITNWIAGLAMNKIYQPYIVKKITTIDGKVIYEKHPKIIRENIANEDNLKIVQKGMRMVATDGSAKAFFGNFPISVAGKTGTPEILGKRKLNAIFSAYAPFENPEIVLTILIEEVPSGSVATLPLHKEILKTYFEEKRPDLFGYATPKAFIQPLQATTTE